MHINKDFEELFHLLNSVHAEYLVVGAYAVIFHTEPRVTKDIDIWIKSDRKNAEKVYEALRKFGAPLHELAVRDLLNSRMVYQIGIEPNRIDVLMGLGGLSFDKAWQRRREDRYGDAKIALLGLKDVIWAKKKAGRPRDKSDLEVLLKVKKTGVRKKRAP